MLSLIQLFATEVSFFSCTSPTPSYCPQQIDAQIALSDVAAHYAIRLVCSSRRVLCETFGAPQKMREVQTCGRFPCLERATEQLSSLVGLRAHLARGVVKETTDWLGRSRNNTNLLAKSLQKLHEEASVELEEATAMIGALQLASLEEQIEGQDIASIQEMQKTRVIEIIDTLTKCLTPYRNAYFLGFTEPYHEYKTALIMQWVTRNNLGKHIQSAISTPEALFTIENKLQDFKTECLSRSYNYRNRFEPVHPDAREALVDMLVSLKMWDLVDFSRYHGEEVNLSRLPDEEAREIVDAHIERYMESIFSR